MCVSRRRGDLVSPGHRLYNRDPTNYHNYYYYSEQTNRSDVVGT